MSKICRQCKSPLSPEDRFCGKCGQQISKYPNTDKKLFSPTLDSYNALREKITSAANKSNKKANVIFLIFTAIALLLIAFLWWDRKQPSLHFLWRQGYMATRPVRKQQYLRSLFEV